jgi:hypothetical protein
MVSAPPTATAVSKASPNTRSGRPGVESAAPSRAAAAAGDGHAARCRILARPPRSDAHWSATASQAHARLRPAAVVTSGATARALCHEGARELKARRTIALRDKRSSQAGGISRSECRDIPLAQDQISGTVSSAAAPERPNRPLPMHSIDSMHVNAAPAIGETVAHGPDVSGHGGAVASRPKAAAGSARSAGDGEDQRVTIAAAAMTCPLARLARDARIRPESESARFVEWLHSPVPPRRCGFRVLVQTRAGVVL